MTPDRPFAWWGTPTTRAHRSAPAQPAVALTRRPFARRNPSVLQRDSSTLQTAKIFHFTGSNTPYESHE